MEFAVLGSAWALPGALKILQGTSMQWFQQSMYHTLLLPALSLSLLLAWLARPAAAEKLPPGFLKHLASYMIVWMCCIAADWLQGPYVYALYSAYGFSESAIMALFVAGYGASGVCSCGIGSVADCFGRKKCCMAFCIFHMIAGITMHWNLYPLLMLGRISSGIGTAILFSCFECWMVSEHNFRHRFSSSLLSYMFGLNFCAMYFVAVLSGLGAQFAVDNTQLSAVRGSMYVGGFTVPYDISIALLCIGFALIALLWKENYGDGQKPGQLLICDALCLLIKDPSCRRLCIIVAIFEGSMYVFVSNWTLALQSQDIQPPHGLIFALFMMAAMCGSSVATLGRGMIPRRQLRFILLLCVLSFAVASRSACGAVGCCLGAFLTFEFCVGWYFPCVGILKSECVPEQIRGSMYNLFRVPLNVLVLVLLLTHIGTELRFAICSFLLSFAVLATFGLVGHKQPLPETVEVASSP